LKTNFGFLGHFYSSASSETQLDLSIYYPKFEYTLSTQLAKISWIDWVSSVGGVLGLFLGVSFFSLIEILTILSEVLGGLKKNKKVITTENENHTCKLMVDFVSVSLKFTHLFK
jgi:hypothetical protein